MGWHSKPSEWRKWSPGNWSFIMGVIWGNRDIMESDLGRRYRDQVFGPIVHYLYSVPRAKSGRGLKAGMEKNRGTRLGLLQSSKSYWSRIKMTRGKLCGPGLTRARDEV